MTASIITIGDEILIGQITDTNSAFIAKALDKIGVETIEMRSISDKREQILDTFRDLQNRVNFVVITGGLGPTKDDITKKTICDYFGDTLVENPQVLAHVTKLIEGFYNRPISQMNKDQALVPSMAEVLTNSNGTAPGMWVQKEDTVFISLPGVPYEMKTIVNDELIPKIVKQYQRPYILHKTILTYGMGESMLAERIEDWENNLPDFIKLAYLPSPGRVRLRLTARGQNEQILKEAVSEQALKVAQIIPEIIVGFEESETIEVMIGKLLLERKMKLATAESMTGGKIAHVITSISGSSGYFMGSIVSYSKEAKINVLGVKPETISEFSVVSEQVATEMATRIKMLMNTDFAIAITGNAGPTTDQTDEEVGVVFIAIATPNDVITTKFNFGQPREKVIDRTVNKSLELLQKEILKIAIIQN